jgi:hypothetical protein
MASSSRKLASDGERRRERARGVARQDADCQVTAGDGNEVAAGVTHHIQRRETREHGAADRVDGRLAFRRRNQGFTETAKQSEERDRPRSQGISHVAGPSRKSLAEYK